MARHSSTSRRELFGVLAGTTALGAAGCLSGGGDETTADGDGTTVVVGPDGDREYEPKSLTVAVDETVTWTWDSSNHNVVVETQPDGADWRGTEGAPTKTFDEGHEYSHAFETPGTYAYFCNPHKGLGMTGEIVVE